MIDMVRIPVTEDEKYMKEAMKQARKAYKLGRQDNWKRVQQKKYR